MRGSPSRSLRSRLGTSAGDLVPENDEQAAVLAGKLLSRRAAPHSWKELAPACGPARAHIAGREPVRSRWRTADVAVTWGDVAKTLDRLEALLPRLDAEPGCWRSGSAG